MLEMDLVFEKNIPEETCKKKLPIGSNLEGREQKKNIWESIVWRCPRVKHREAIWQ